MLDRESSLRLDLLRFPLIVGVVFIHSYSATVGLSDGNIGTHQPNFASDYLRTLISQCAARIATPLFFLISGYLFFSGSEWSAKSYSAKLQRRTKTLLIPFIFWNLITLAAVSLAQAIPSVRVFFSGDNKLISEFNTSDYLNALIGVNRYPIAYQFWFIRDLIIMTLLAPAILIALKFTPLPYLSILSLCWLQGYWAVPTLSAESLLFFSVGAHLCLAKKGLFFLDKFGPIATGIYILIIFTDALTINNSINPYLHKFGIILGIITSLFLTKLVERRENIKLPLLQLSGASFFVYATHEPLLTILRKVSYKILSPESSIMILFLYFCVAIIVIAACVTAYRGLNRSAPKFVNIVIGGR